MLMEHCSGPAFRQRFQRLRAWDGGGSAFVETIWKRSPGTVRPLAGTLSLSMSSSHRLETEIPPKACEPTPMPVAPRPRPHPDPRSAAALPDVGPDAVAAEVRAISMELRQRLDRHALSRKVFPHLAVVERELKRGTYRGLSILSPEILDTALEQLVMVMGRSPGELARLRAHMLETMLARRTEHGELGSP